MAATPAACVCVGGGISRDMAVATDDDDGLGGEVLWLDRPPAEAKLLPALKSLRKGCVSSWLAVSRRAGSFSKQHWMKSLKVDEYAGPGSGEGSST